MSTLCVTLAFVLSVGLVSCEKPVVSCPAPRSPLHGQSFLYQDGQVVKYVCEPGFEIRGRPTARCVDGAWEDPAPMCIPMGETDDLEDLLLPPDTPEESADLVTPPRRPLFNWGGDEDIDDDEIDDGNSTATDDDDTPMGDQPRVRTVVYPNRVLLRNALLRRAALRSRVIELEEADRKNKEGGRSVHLQGPPPSVLYLRRSGKSSDGPAGQQVRTAAVEQEGESTEQPQGDKGGDAQRQYYWWAAQHYYQHPQSAALVDYTSVHPYGLTESQMAWINSLHPETRDQYLRDIYGVRTDHVVEAQRAQAFLSRYGDAYNYYHPYYYYREPLAVLTQQDIVSTYDYSCNQAGSPFVRAPKLRNAHIAKYDRRQNPNAPNNHYLAVVYRCNPGYVMYDTRHTDLFCSKRAWIGTDPVCVRARV
ncbi:hypothetical protein JTE90_004140 [Oedothorax gibbosus]|uniref:Sushi domain-containing protein n=1 Tax=Oedothorax gibbosus TaxID=931172 RepID=A0AAV6UG06_9ARAC|nr:hypothetical protein JTE90_004140 [Oedothorax gibbosus]